MSDAWEKKWQQSDLEAKFAQEEAQQKAEDNVSSLAAQLTGHTYIGRHLPGSSFRSSGGCCNML